MSPPRLLPRAALVALLALATAVAVASPVSAAPAPRSAAAFADSFGVNVHLFYDDTPYARTATVVARLRQLGVRHVRDGLAPERPDQILALRALHRAGIRSTLLLGAPGRDPAPLLRTVRDHLPGAVEAVEGPNEYWTSGPGWERRLVPFQDLLFSRTRRERALAGVEIVGASVGGVRLARSLDRGNIHPYPGGGPPEANVRDELRRAAAVSGRKRVWATETGYHDALHMRRGTHQPATTRSAQAVYLPRLFAAYFAAGVQRTYVYELLDEFRDPRRRDPQARYGLLDHGLRPKPQFHALRRLIALVRDRRAPVRPLAYGVRDTGSGLRQLLLSRSDGGWQVLLWRARAVDAGGDARGARATVRLALPFAARTSVASPTAGTRRSLGRGRTATLRVGATLQVVSVRPLRAGAAQRRARGRRAA